MRSKLSVALVALLASGTASAGEGMWVPQQLPEIAMPLKRAGLGLDPLQLADLTADPLGAVVSLDGCTASFVSPQGLVATNHHCAYGAIQLNSTAESNLLQDGFVPATMSQELSAGPNTRIYVLESITDVTEQAKAAIASAGEDPLRRTHALETFEKAQILKCEAGDSYRCRLYSFSGGNTYRLFKNIEIKDVRLAYAPPGSVGKFGGDIDNWMWPRHTGDFAFYRAYVGKDGKPAAFSPDNVPYQPRHWLKFADQPLRDGDFVMVAGYPGRTNRYALADEFDNTANWRYPTVARHYENLTALMVAAGETDPDIQVKYADLMAHLSNINKNYGGQLEGFKRIDARGHKHDEEAAMLAWLTQQGTAGEQALHAHRMLASLAKQTETTQKRDLVLEQFNRTGTIGAAITLYRLAIERSKPDAEREVGYQNRDLPDILGTLQQMERRYAAPMDRQLQQYWLDQYVRLPTDQQLASVDRWLRGKDAASVQATIDRLAGTQLHDAEQRLQWLQADRIAFESSDDPAIAYAVSVTPTLLALERKQKDRAGELLKWQPIYLQALADHRKSQGQFVYPDANSSLRITFGKVAGYSPKDGVRLTSFTTLEGIAAKETGTAPFDSPRALLEAVAGKRHAGLVDAQLASVPVNFLADVDITGGNSGSPVLDAHGKLVGLAFDGNWESVSSNWVFDPPQTRMIAVDSRYIEWIMREVAPAPQLLRELNLVR